MITKHSQLKVIVLRPLNDNTSPITNTEIPASGDRLYNATTDAFNINDGFGGFYKEWVDAANFGRNSGNPEAVDSSGNDANAPIKFVQNRDTSNDRSPLYPRPLEESQWINPNCINGIKITGIPVIQPSNNLLLAGPQVGGQAIPVLDEFTYRIQVSGHGDRTDMIHGAYNTPTTFGTFTSPDWTSYTFAGVLTNDQESRAITLESLANNFNYHSQSMSFMVCLDSAGTAATGSTTVLALSDGTVTNGTKVIIGYDKKGRPVTFKMDNSYREAFVQLEAAHAGMSLRPYLLPGTTNAPAGVPLAGALVPTNNFAILSIDEGQAYYDYKMNTKRRVSLGLLKGFDNVSQEEISAPVEGSGQSRQLDIFYKANEQYNQVARPQPYMSYHVAFPNEILSNATYDIFVIEHCHMRTATSGIPAQMPHTTMIAVVSYEDPNTPYFEAAGAGNPNPQKTYIQNVLNDFNTNFNFGNPTLAL